jgi:zinc transport system permease protein
MVRALLAAALVGFTAPAVGIFLVQRRLALVGDGMGHVALTGVAVGLLTGNAPVATALVAAVAGAVVIELVRARGRTGGDVALAVMFYGGIAGGVVLVSRSEDGSAATLNSYLFGSITTTTAADLTVFAVLSVVVAGTCLVLARRLFAVSSDEEYARASGLPVLRLNLLLAVLTAVTVVVSMRVVGLLLISALMIVPNAAAQQVLGVVTSYYANTPSGGTIVLYAIAVFGAAAGGAVVRSRLARRHHAPAEDHPHEHGPDCGHPPVVHAGHVDYVHDGHRHAPHGAHYDEH